MSEKLRTIKFILPWQGHVEGEMWTPEMPDQANLLVLRNIAEYVEEEKPKDKRK